MGRYCRMCGRERANERFSGRGHRILVCQDCRKRPKSERERVECEREIIGYLQQTNISAKNVERLNSLTESLHADIGALARLVPEVAQVKPHRRRRLKVLASTRPDLVSALEEARARLLRASGD